LQIALQYFNILKVSSIVRSLHKRSGRTYRVMDLKPCRRHLEPARGSRTRPTASMPSGHWWLRGCFSPHSRPALNLLFDLSMGATTGMTASNWRMQHLYGHHRGIDLPYRGDRAIAEDYSPPRALWFSAMSIWETFYSPIRESWRKGILNNVKLPISYRWAFCDQLLLVLMVAVLAAWQPRVVLIYLLPWYLVTHFVTRYVDYLNHYGCDENSDDPYVRANNSLSWWFNYSTHNFGYHTAHHIRPGAHRTELPAIHRAIADKIPERHLKRFSWSWVLMPYHFYRASTGRM
jgi:fatty acid desaturase